jgi:Concanavalin A-like lectin/glucanases superfamily
MATVAYYKLENVNDSTGNGYTLTNNGTVTFTAGKYDNAANLGNTNSTKSLTNVALAAVSYPITIVGWFNPKIVNDNGNIFSLADDSVHYYQLKLRDSDSHIVFRSNNDTQAADVDTGVTAVVDTWHHFAVTINSTTSVTIYINGTLTNNAATIFVASGLDRLSLGALGRSSPLQFYSGLIDDVGFYSHALSATDIAGIYNSPMCQAVDLYYKLDESSGNVSDATGNALTGTNTDVTFGSGKIGNAGTFNGTSSRISTSTTLRYERTKAFSVSAWIKTSVSSGERAIYSTQENSGSYRGFTFWSSYGGSNKLFVSIGNTGGVIEKGATTTSLADGTWKHVVFTYDGSSTAAGVNMYVNGSLESMSTSTDTLGSSIVGTSGVYLGRRDDGLYYSGDMDELGVWNRVLSATEVSTLYNSGSGKQYNFTTTAYSMTADVGTLTLTGQTASLGILYTLTASVGSLILTGMEAVLRLSGWTNQSKNSTTFTNQTKNSTTFTNQTKNSTTWTNQSKS